MKKLVKKNWIFIILVLLVIINSAWLVFDGLPYQHDIGFHYSRMISLANTIKNGDFLALIHDTFFGYGYALGIFYGNLFFYIPALFYIIGIPAMLSFKLFYILINVGTVIITYFSAKNIIKDKKIAVIITTLYTLSEYRLFDIFVRGAVGEMLAFMVAPLVILGLYEIIYNDSRKWYLFTIGFVLLLLSHLITTVIMAFFCLIIIIFNYRRFIKEKYRFKNLIISGVVGVLLGAFFLFPILEQSLLSEISILVNGSVYYPKGASIIRLFAPEGFFKVYLGVTIVLLIPIRMFLRKKDVNKKYYDMLSFCDLLLGLGIISWLSITNIFPWKFLGSIISFIQFPWRFLFFSTLFISISTGIILYLFLKLDYKKLINGIFNFIVVASLVTVGLYSLQYGIRKIHYDSFELNEIGNGEYLLADTDLNEMKMDDSRYLEAYFVSNNSELEFNYEKLGTNVKVNYSNNLENNSYIEVPLFNYLGYNISPNLEVVNGDNGLMRVYLPDQKGSFEIWYEGTMIQKISYSISFISLITFSLYLVKIYRKK